MQEIYSETSKHESVDRVIPDWVIARFRQYNNYRDCLKLLTYVATSLNRRNNGKIMFSQTEFVRKHHGLTQLKTDKAIRLLFNLGVMKTRIPTASGLRRHNILYGRLCWLPTTTDAPSLMYLGEPE